MVDIMSGPNYPLARAFEMAGWRIFAIDLLFGEGHDLSNLDNQVTIRKQISFGQRWIAPTNHGSEKYHASMRTAEPCQGHCEVWNSLWECLSSKVMIKKEWQRVILPPNSFLEN